MEKVFYEIDTQWDGSSIGHSPVKIVLKHGEEKFVNVEVDAPFFDDPAPSGNAGSPFPQLWDYEVVEIFFLGKDDKYLEIEFCPHGQHLVLMLNGKRNMIKDQLSLEYSSSIDKANMRWTGKASIPLSYFPANVGKLNAYAIHGSGPNRVYEALYPAEAKKHSEPDFHRLEYFGEVDLGSYLPDYEVESELWKQALLS